MIYNDINNLIATAMKDHDKERTDTLRLIKAELLKAEKDGTVISDSSEIKILTKMVTQREDSIKQYKEANRLDLVEKEQKEVDIIKQYIPEQPSDEEISKYVGIVISKFVEYNGSVSMKDTRTILATVKEKYDTPTVGKIVSTEIKKYL